MLIKAFKISLALSLCTTACAHNRPHLTAAMLPPPHGTSHQKAAAPSDDHFAASDLTIATIDKAPIKLSQLGQPTQQRFTELRNTYHQQLLGLQWEAAQEYVDELLMNAHAKRKGISRQALTTKYITERLVEPSEAHMQQWFQRHQAGLGITFELAKPFIRRHLLKGQRAQLQRSLIEPMRRSAGGPKVKLTIPQLLRDPYFAPHKSTAGPAIGTHQAPVTIVSFSDYGCPHCAQSHQILSQLLRDYAGKIRVVHRYFPQYQSPHSVLAAQAAHCSDEQDRFWRYHSLLFNHTTALNTAALQQLAKRANLNSDIFEQCLHSDRAKNAVRSHRDLGIKHGVEGTPSLYINGIKMVGVLPLPIIKAIVDHELNA